MYKLLSENRYFCFKYRKKILFKISQKEKKYYCTHLQKVLYLIHHTNINYFYILFFNGKLCTQLLICKYLMHIIVVEIYKKYCLHEMQLYILYIQLCKYQKAKKIRKNK